MLRILIAVLVALAPQGLLARDIAGAAYVEPTGAYGHGALAGGEYAGLRIDYDDGSHAVLRLAAAVFEDTAPRLHDFDGDGAPELVVVVSGFATGAMVQIIDVVGDNARSIGQTEPIGRRHRWLAVAGIADFDGDGRAEVAYVDRPHLAKVLRLVAVDMRPGEARLTPLAEAPGLTNHHLGSAEIEGGVRACPGAAPVIVTADADWREIVETRFVEGRLRSTSVGAYTGTESLATRLSCD